MKKLKTLLDYLEDNFSIEVKDRDIFKRAFVHRSYVNENREKKIEHNERLEFLGDAVLELAVTDYIYDNYPKKGEGVLTNWRAALVRGSNLAQAANKLDLGNYLRLSKGEEKSGGREKEVILAGTFEALIGAIYLDQGYMKAEKFIQTEIITYLESIIKEGKHIDPKTYFQELAQDKYGITPAYEVVSEAGPDHNKVFKIAVFLDEKKVGLGEGSSKQKAEASAAKNALDKLKLESEETVD